jgi:uncharacterized protein (DUF2384 family)
VKTKKGEVDESVLGLAVDVLGGREAAHEWLGKPALGLQFKTPIELMRSSQEAAGKNAPRGVHVNAL